MKSNTTFPIYPDPIYGLVHISSVLSGKVFNAEEAKKARFAKVYEEYSKPLFKFCLYKLSNREKAIDLVSDTFLRTWQYLAQGNCIENEKSFLYTTARHLIIDEYRRKKNISLDLLISLGFETSYTDAQEIYNYLDGRIILKEVNKLPLSYSSVIMMRYVNDFSIGEISKILKSSENSISVKIHRGLSKLRSAVVQ